MKFSHRSFPRLAILAAIFLPILVHAESTETPTEAIPWSEIGAKAGADYEGDGLSITPSADGAILNSIFQRLRGEATPEGLWLKSTAEESEGDRFRLVAGAYGRAGGEATPLPQMGRVETGEKLVSYFRPGLVEEYSTSMDGVRQDFLVLQRPPGIGELQVELALDGARAEAAGFGARLVLEQSGRHIAYSRLHVVDAEGTELTARIEIVAADRLVISVDDAAAKYPVRIDPTFSDENWVSMGGFLGANNTISALALDDSGNLYVGGNFTAIGDVAANRIAKWNGSKWSALGSGTGNNRFVFALAVDDSGNLYAGGGFASMGGVAGTARIARWDGNSWSALGSGVNNGVVYTLALDGSGNLYAGGTFTTAGGVMANRVARWNGSNWSALGTGMDDRVSALALDRSGSLYAGGWFSTADGIVANSVASWDGSSWSALGTGMNSYSQVNTLALDGSDNLYAGGTFTTAGGVTANRIARWDGSSWSALGTGMNAAVSALAVDDSGNLYAGGLFSHTGELEGGLVRWDGSSWHRVGPTAMSSVGVLVLDGVGNLYAGGGFTTAGGVTAKHVALWDGSNWSALGAGMVGTVNALAVDSNNLYAGGARFNPGSLGNAWIGTGLNSIVSALAVDDSGNLYAGGYFTAAGGVAARYIARWDGCSWSALGTGMDGQVTSLVLDGGSGFFPVKMLKFIGAG